MTIRQPEPIQRRATTIQNTSPHRPAHNIGKKSHHIKKGRLHQKKTQQVSTLEPVFLVNSSPVLVTATPLCDCEEAPLLPKLRGYFAEFLRESCLAPLGILYLPTCVGFGYRYPFVEGRSSFSWEYGMGYFSVVTPGTRTLARGIFSTPSYPEKGHLTSLNR
ncbi:hypothetical protein R6Q57_016100 [Mikania cordata]